MAGVTATISVAAFRNDWQTHMPIAALCQRWSITKDQVIRLAVVWELPRRHDRKLRAKPVRQRDPTPREIAQACRDIQATWDERTREERRVHKTQHVSLSPISMPDNVRDYVEDLNREVEW